MSFVRSPARTIQVPGASVPAGYMLEWPPKDPAARLDYSLDLTPILRDSNDIIAHFDISPAPSGGGFGASMLSDAEVAQLDNPSHIATVWLSGGGAQPSWQGVLFTITTAAGRVLDLAVWVLVSSQSVNNMVTPAIAIGAQGRPGTSLLTDDGPPSALLGSDGDAYVDRLTGEIWVRSGGTWTDTGQTLLGPIGPQGPAGSLTIYGTGDPSPSTGQDGYQYIDTSSGRIWSRANGAWTLNAALATSAALADTTSVAQAAQQTANQALTGSGLPTTLETTGTNLALDATHSNKVILATDLLAITIAGGSDALASGKAFTCQVIAAGGYDVYLGPNITNGSGDGLIRAGGKADITVYRTGNTIAGIAQGDTGTAPSSQRLSSDFATLSRNSFWTMTSDFSALAVVVPDHFTLLADFALAGLAAAQHNFTFKTDFAAKIFLEGPIDTATYTPFLMEALASARGVFAEGAMPTATGSFELGTLGATDIADVVRSDFSTQKFFLQTHAAVGVLDTILTNAGAIIGSMIIGEAVIG